MDFLESVGKLLLPNHSLLEQDLIDEVYVASKQKITMQTADTWEELARWSTSRLEIAGRKWKPASRWWGNGCNGRHMEIDVVAESLDGNYILFGEAKWEKTTNVDQVMNKLSQQTENFPKIGKRKIVLAAWCKHPLNHPEDTHVFGAKEVLSAVKN